MYSVVNGCHKVKGSGNLKTDVGQTCSKPQAMKTRKFGTKTAFIDTKLIINIPYKI